MGIGKISGYKSGFARLSGFSDVMDFGNPAVIAKLKQAKKDTIYSCKPIKVECEFCKEKLGLLNDDVFVKRAEKLNKE